jgi:hypothetical protein
VCVRAVADCQRMQLFAASGLVESAAAAIRRSERAGLGVAGRRRAPWFGHESSRAASSWGSVRCGAARSSCARELRARRRSSSQPRPPAIAGDAPTGRGVCEPISGGHGVMPEASSLALPLGSVRRRLAGCRCTRRCADRAVVDGRCMHQRRRQALVGRCSWGRSPSPRTEIGGRRGQWGRRMRGSGCAGGRGAVTVTPRVSGRGGLGFVSGGSW